MANVVMKDVRKDKEIDTIKEKEIISEVLTMKNKKMVFGDIINNFNKIIIFNFVF